MLCMYSLLFFLVILIEQYTNLDPWIQSFFYNDTKKIWLISAQEHNGILGRIVYRGYKDALILSGILALFFIIYYTVRKKHQLLRIALVKYLSALIVVPLIVALLKPITNVYCPTQLDIFNGSVPYVRILEHYPLSFSQPHGRCFPAGHATSGFFFVILYYILQHSSYARYKWWGLVFGITLGWLCGLYQMARGEHFFSHTLATMIIALASAWTINACINALYKIHPST